MVSLEKEKERMKQVFEIPDTLYLREKAALRYKTPGSLWLQGIRNHGRTDQTNGIRPEDRKLRLRRGL